MNIKKIVSFFLLCALVLSLFSCTGRGGEQTTAPVMSDDAKDSGSIPTSDVPQGKAVAITFDDGPHVERTRQIVDKLKEHGATATFFLVGDRLNSVTGEAIRYAVENGCEIAIHGYTHEIYYDRCSDQEYEAELGDTAKAIHKYLGDDYEIRLMRPVGGRITEERAASCPYEVVLWTLDSSDWEYKGVYDDDERTRQNIDTIVDNVLSNVREGDVILMHEIYHNSYEAFCVIIDRLYEMGYCCVTVSELYALNGQ